MELQRWRRQSSFLAASSFFALGSRAFPGALQHRHKQRRTHGLHPRVPSLHLLQGRMSQGAGTSEQTLVDRQTLDGLKVEDSSPNLGRKQGSEEWFTAPYLPVPKLGASSTWSRSEAAMLEAKSPWQNHSRVCHAQEGTTEPP